MNQHELRELETRRAKLQAKIKRIQREAQDTTYSLQENRKKLANLQQQIEARTTKPTVSEHAILRYLERSGRIDIEAVRQEILSDNTAKLIKALGSGKFPIGNGLFAQVKKNVVVTVVD